MTPQPLLHLRSLPLGRSAGSRPVGRTRTGSVAIGTPTLPVPGPEPWAHGRWRAALLVWRPRVAMRKGLARSGKSRTLL
eukprot:8732837-Lingulodinium_polyedra.AAC.1